MTYRDPERLPTVVYQKTKVGWEIVEGKMFQSSIPTDRIDENGDPFKVAENEIWIYGEGLYRIHNKSKGYLAMQGGSPIKDTNDFG